MINSPTRKFIFVHIHKCGGTSVGRALSSLNRKGDIAVGYRRFERAPSFRGLNKHSYAQQIREFGGR